MNYTVFFFNGSTKKLLNYISGVHCISIRKHWSRAFLFTKIHKCGSFSGALPLSGSWRSSPEVSSSARTPSRGIYSRSCECTTLGLPHAVCQGSPGLHSVPLTLKMSSLNTALNFCHTLVLHVKIKLLSHLQSRGTSNQSANGDNGLALIHMSCPAVLSQS